jgi:hypothetical protein
MPFNYQGKNNNCTQNPFMASLRTHNNCSRESINRRMELPKLFKRNYSKNSNGPIGGQPQENDSLYNGGGSID